MINVYLDDLRPCPIGFALARSAEECLLLVSEYEVGILSLDYELGYGLPNGFSVVQGIIVSGKYPREVFVHSSSLMGRAQMVHALREAAPAHVVIHDGPMPPAVLTAAAAQDQKAAAGDGTDA